MTGSKDPSHEEKGLKGPKTSRPTEGPTPAAPKGSGGGSSQGK
jgi:hypothetical protein